MNIIQSYAGKAVPETPQVKQLKEQLIDKKKIYISNSDLNPQILDLKIIHFNKDSEVLDENGYTQPKISSDYKVALFLFDTGEVVVDNKLFHVHKGDLLVLKPNQIYYSKDYGTAYTVHFSLTANQNTDFIEYNTYLEEINNFIPSNRIEMFVSMFEDLLSSYYDNTNLKYLKLKYKLDKFIFNLMDTALEFNKNDKSTYKNRTICDKTIEYMARHLEENIGLNELSDQVNLHPVYYHRLFSKTIGISPVSYLKNLRMNLAKKLLLSSDMKVKLIAIKCGYSNPSYFISQFKTEFSCTPSEFREKNQYNIN